MIQYKAIIQYSSVFSKHSAVLKST